jgi:dTDP-3-amino-3,4,6-trideoxy-alpha-D-glucose transaminase
MSVPLFATAPALRPLLDEVAERQAAVLRSGRYILGPEGEAFEREFAAFLGVRYCVGVANGTDALTIALRALGVGDGDEVVVPALTFFATAEAVVNCGATPVFCDVDPETLVMTAATAEPCLGSRTRALIPVHLYGNPAPTRQARRSSGPRSGVSGGWRSIVLSLAKVTPGPTKTSSSITVPPVR